MQSSKSVIKAQALYEIRYDGIDSCSYELNPIASTDATILAWKPLDKK